MKTRYSSFESNNSTDVSQLYHKFETILSWNRSFEKIIINTREIWAHTCFNSLFFFRSIRNVSLGVSFTLQKNVNFDEKMKVMPFTSNAIAHAWILELFPERSETLEQPNIFFCMLSWKVFTAHDIHLLIQKGCDSRWRLTWQKDSFENRLHTHIEDDSVCLIFD